MKLLKDDPRLLQFVLDEISPSDRIIVENAINSQPEISAEVQILKNIYLDVSSAESLPNNLRLTSERQKSLFNKTIDKKHFSFFGLQWSFKHWGYSAGGLIAATFAFLVFTHSLKNEVSDQTASVRPTIPADSDLAATGTAAQPAPAQPTPPSMVSNETTESEEKSTLGGSAPEPHVADNSKDLPKAKETAFSEPAKMITADKIEKDSNADDLYAATGESKDFKQDESPQAAVELKAVSAAPTSELGMARRRGKEMNNSGAINEIARVEPQPVQRAIISKKLFTSSKSGAALALPKTAPQVESEKTDSEGMKSAFGSGNVRTKGKSNEVDSDQATHQFEVLISSRALEAEQIKTMTDHVKSCLIKNYIGRELKIEFFPQEDKFNVTNPNPTGAELNFAKCSQKAFGPPMAPYIKVISVELKSTFSK